MTALDDAAHELAGVPDGLVSRFGVVAQVTESADRHRGLRLFTAHAAAGTGAGAGRTPDRKRIAGYGRTLVSAERARLIAVAEAAERYAADFPGEELIWATAAELGRSALDPARYPRCSAAEYGHPRCPLVPFDPDASIRWVRGLELTSGQPVWVPAVMACYRLSDLVPAEQFSYRISTGYSVHTDRAEAVVGGICEVIERDAVALVWQQRLPLPAAGSAADSAALRQLCDWSTRHFVRTHVFDATTDLGVPTVYCLQASEHDQRARNVVGCATARTLSQAAEKALIETISIRGMFHTDEELVEDTSRFFSIEHGARYMGVPERAEAFGFLTAPSGRPRKPVAASLPGPGLPEEPAAALAELAALFAGRAMPVAVVDQTTSELAAAGLTCVSVVIPDLQPMSLLPLAQFRAHPRLYDAPARMGYPVRQEQELNPWPQPFT